MGNCTNFMPILGTSSEVPYGKREIPFDQVSEGKKFWPGGWGGKGGRGWGEERGRLSKGGKNFRRVFATQSGSGDSQGTHPHTLTHTDTLTHTHTHTHTHTLHILLQKLDTHTYRGFQRAVYIFSTDNFIVHSVCSAWEKYLMKQICFAKY